MREEVAMKINLPESRVQVRAGDIHESARTSVSVTDETIYGYVGRCFVTEGF